MASTRMVAIGLAAVALSFDPEPTRTDAFPVPTVPWSPRTYVCYRAEGPITIDGQLHDASWRSAPWTLDFVDIEGESKPHPRHRTRAKMLWDDTYLYAAVEMVEPHVWALLTQRDAVIYHDNDIEIFIDPDGDTHEYYELEVNALGTEWDLLLIKPYRDGGPAVNAWDIQGLRTAVHIDGTLNNPSDTDRGWSIEMALPWAVLRECAHRPTPPNSGDQWRINFSRVEWRVGVSESIYVKEIDPETGKHLPEDNWVWSPQGLIAMHYPEMWGFVQFSSDVPDPTGASPPPVVIFPGESARWFLRRVYYAEKAWFAEHGAYTDEIDSLGVAPAGESVIGPLDLHVTPDMFEATITATDSTVHHISQDGHVW